MIYNMIICQNPLIILKSIDFAHLSGESSSLDSGNIDLLDLGPFTMARQPGLGEAPQSCPGVVGFVGEPRLCQLPVLRTAWHKLVVLWLSILRRSWRHGGFPTAATAATAATDVSMFSIAAQRSSCYA